MITTEDKLLLLSKLAARFKEQGITWAVGASLLLYFKGYVDSFNDLDIMVTEKDSLMMDKILNEMGEFRVSEKGNFATKYFREYVIESVDVDMIGGFAIVNDGKVIDCDLDKSEITGFAEVHGQLIPLHSVSLWRKYYALMGREKRVELIDQKGLLE